MTVWAWHHAGKPSVFRTTSGELLSLEQRLQIADSTGVTLGADVHERRSQRLTDSFDRSTPPSLEIVTFGFSRKYDMTPSSIGDLLLDLQLLAFYQPGAFRDAVTDKPLAHVDYNKHIVIRGNEDSGYYIGTAFAPPGWLSCRIHRLLEDWIALYGGSK
jgi:hypothetical protein